MIDISKLTEDDKGRNVIYTPRFGKPEVGQLTSWNQYFVYVRYRGPQGEPCEPEDVTFEDNSDENSKA